MFSAFGWVLFGFAVWGLCIVMHAMQKRFAPEWNSGQPGQNWWDFLWGEEEKKPSSQSHNAAPKSQEIDDLKKRIEVLEAIVTDKHYQFDEEIRNSR